MGAAEGEGIADVSEFQLIVAGIVLAVLCVVMAVVSVRRQDDAPSEPTGVRILDIAGEWIPLAATFSHVRDDGVKVFTATVPATVLLGDRHEVRIGVMPARSELQVEMEAL